VSYFAYERFNVYAPNPGGASGNCLKIIREVQIVPGYRLGRILPPSPEPSPKGRGSAVEGSLAANFLAPQGLRRFLQVHSQTVPPSLGALFPVEEKSLSG
jgi:hypothetical protein